MSLGSQLRRRLYKETVSFKGRDQRFPLVVALEEPQEEASTKTLEVPLEEAREEELQEEDPLEVKIPIHYLGSLRSRHQRRSISPNSS